MNYQIAYPPNVVIDITRKCNLNCKMCYLTGMKKKGFFNYDKDDKFLPYCIFKNIIYELVSNIPTFIDSPLNVCFSGGEPFLHPQFFEMIEFINKEDPLGHKIASTIFTNLTFDTQVLENLFTNYPKFSPYALRISLDGLKTEHNLMRGEGIYEKVISNIKKIQKIKNKYKLKKPHLFLFYVINKLNIRSLVDFVYFAQKIGIEKIFFAFVQWSNKKISKACLSEFSKRLDWQGEMYHVIEGVEHSLGNLGAEEINVLISQIKKIHTIKSQLNIEIVFFPDFSYNLDVLEKEIHLWFSDNFYKVDYCNLVYSWIRINYDGNVFPICSTIFYSFGNLIENPSLKDILRGTRTKKFFEEIKNNGYFFVCQRCCRRSDISRTIETLEN